LIPAINLPSSFRTGAAAGSVASSVATFNNILPDAPIATFQMVAWDNSSGLYPTWTEASIAWMADLIAAGKSPLFTMAALAALSAAALLIARRMYVPPCGLRRQSEAATALLLIQPRPRARKRRRASLVAALHIFRNGCSVLLTRSATNRRAPEI
jgi:hypothetical protein